MVVETVIVSVDGSDASRAAVEWCARMVDPASIVLAVGGLGELARFAVDMPGVGLSSAAIEKTFRESWCAPLERAGLNWKPIFDDHTQATAVARAIDANAPDLVVVGKPAHIAVDMLLGGQVQHVLHHAKCPVLLVPTPH